MPDHSELFLHTLKDLERRIESEDPYEILGISALMRKLFLEKHSLTRSTGEITLGFASAPCQLR
jgi:hypothetical protein